MSNIEFKKEDLENVALLARLDLKEGEKDKFLVEIKEILEYIGQVSNMASSQVENSGGVNYGKQFENSTNKNITREDLVLNEANNYTSSLLANAPAREGDFIKVPQVLNKHKK